MGLTFLHTCRQPNVAARKINIRGRLANGIFNYPFLSFVGKRVRGFVSEYIQHVKDDGWKEEETAFCSSSSRSENKHLSAAAVLEWRRRRRRRSKISDFL